MAYFHFVSPLVLRAAPGDGRDHPTGRIDVEEKRRGGGPEQRKMTHSAHTR